MSNKAALRKLMKDILKSLPASVKEYQSNRISHYLLHQSTKFRDASHVALYLPMPQEEINITPLIEALLTNQNQYHKHIYVPHINAKTQVCKKFCNLRLKIFGKKFIYKFINILYKI